MYTLTRWTYRLKDQTRQQCWRGIGLLILLLALGACSQTPDETQIKQQLDEIIDAIEARESRVVLGKLADHFSGPNNQNKRDIHQLMIASFLRYKNIKVIRTGLTDIQIQEQSARVTFDVTLTGANRLIPEHLRNYRVSTGWNKIDGDWLLLQADWKAK